MVKTLGESHPDVYYEKTRRFYKKAGFYPLEEIKEIWGEQSPCLIMISLYKICRAPTLWLYTQSKNLIFSSYFSF